MKIKVLTGILVLGLSISITQITRADVDGVADVLNLGYKIYNLLSGGNTGSTTGNTTGSTYKKSGNEFTLSEAMHFKSCNYTINPIKGWDITAEPTSDEFVPNGTETLSFSKGNVYMVVLCIKKEVTLDQWKTGTEKNLGTTFNDYKLLGQETIDFQKTKAHWIAYQGKPQGFDILTRGYLLIVDRDKAGLIASIAVPEDEFKKNEPAFRAAIQSITLN